MIICGIKLTHDGAVALIDDGKLIFSHEMEKIGNNLRFSSITDFSIVHDILASYGYALEDVDRLVIDGWGDIGRLTPKATLISVANGKSTYTLEVAKYGTLVGKQDILKGTAFHYPDYKLSYRSYMHVSSHAMSAYCTSPMARRGESSFILVWDGAMCPQLFYYHYPENRVENLRPLFMLNGHTYSAFAHQFPPYDRMAEDDMSIAGKVMAYIALGKVDPGLLAQCWDIYANRLDKKSLALSTQLITEVARCGEGAAYTPADMMATFHVFLEQLLVRSLQEQIGKMTGYAKNLCFAGGCALNIKWNSAVRSSGVFDEVWVPPFPNDSGAAIGTACCEMLMATGKRYLEWNVYSGPAVAEQPVYPSWAKRSCSLAQLARLLHLTGKPVVVLNGRAELGPRALGNRSIIAPATSPAMKDTLNRIKHREPYRPVAPICTEEDAPEIFAPGTPDPYMLYDHQVRKDWVAKIPAVCHLDGTARLQTISRTGNPEIYELLAQYKKLSGIPVLCNTSANLNGRGFFPDVTSAMEWDGTDLIWSQGVIYYKKASQDALPFEEAAGHSVAVESIEV